MDVNKLLNDVKNLNHYIAATQDIVNMCNSSKIQFNMTTVLSMKKMRSLEIEYFNKCNKSGAAFIIFEYMLRLPPSKTWNLLGKELILLIQYWLEALRRYLISHNPTWWTFLKSLLKFIKDIKQKDQTLPDVLVQETAECLLDLATNSTLNAFQKHEVTSILNICCAESSREIRFSLREKLAGYFLRLSNIMATCGHLPLQFSMMETLLRWLLYRQNRNIRNEVVTEWFPGHIYHEKVINLFLERPWRNVFQDARDLLNAHNEVSGLVTSMQCSRLEVGETVVVTGNEKWTHWLDINSSSKSLTILLEPWLLEGLGGENITTCEVFTITEENTRNVKLHRESEEIVLTVNTIEPPQLLPSACKLLERYGCDMKITISPGGDIARIDKLLRYVFAEKYQILINIEDMPLAREVPSEHNKRNSVSDDTRFSHPAEPRRRKHFGFVVKSINPIAWKSPSTASTSSLAQLHEKLAALPRYRYDKDTVSVCVKPQLSSVSEVSETEEKQSFDTASTIVLTPRCYQRSGVRSFVKTRNLDSESVKNSSRGENYLSTVAVDEDDSANSLLAAALCTTENSIINDSLERLPRDQNFKTDNIVDLLIKEALDREVEVRQGVLDSEINTGDIGRKTQNLQEMDSEAIENTPCIEDNKEVLSVEKNKNPKVNKFTVVSNSTSTDDSTLEDVNVSNVTHRRKMMKNSNIDPFICDQNNEYNFTHDENQTSKIEVVEDYFSKHFSENKTDDLIIRPTLAKRINDTSSEGDNINQEYFHMNKDFNVKDDQFNVKDIEIIDCLNNIVDKVCNELDRIECVIQENTEFKKSEFSDVVPKDGLTTQSINDLELKNKKENKISKETMSKSIESIKLKYTAPKKKEKTFKTKKVAKKSKNKSIKNIPKTDDKLDKNNIVASESAKINDKSIVHNLRSANTKVISENNKEVTPTNIVNESETPVTIRRKRKLYSPKDEQTAIDNWAIQIPETEDSTVVASEKDKDSTVFTDIKTYKRTSKITSKSVATCYKDIEVERQRIRLPRERKATYKVPPMQSSRTKKINDMFDKLKKNNENNEKIIIADRKSIQDDVAIYNYTSDSEDEDFKKKKIEIRNRFSITNLGSATSTMSTRHGRLTNRVNYTENNASSSHASKIKKLKEKRTKTVKHEKAKSKTRKVNLEPTNDLVDEKMREAALEVLNTSLVIERSVEKDLQEQEPKLLLPQMELISDDNAESVRNTTLERKKLNKRNKLDKALSLRRDNGQNKTDTVIRKNEDNRSISPLPGLVIETVQMPHEDPDDSVSTNILQKFKKIYREDPDPSVNVSNTTQNLLYDIDKVNYSPRNEMYNDKMSETVILSQINEDSDACIENPKEKNRNAKSKNKIDNINICSNKSEKSIATVGNSPITAHGNFDEAPPNSDLLKQKLKPRNMELEDLDKSMKEYFIELTEATNINSINDDLHPYYTRLDKLKTDQKFEVNEQPKCDDMADKNSPSVVLSRLSSDEIRKWLPSRHTSVTDNSNSSEVTIKTRKSRMKLDFRSTKKVTPKKKKKENQETTENRKSIISPIKLFEDLIPKSQISHFSDLCDKDAGRHIKNILSNSMNKNTNTNLLKSTPDDLELSADFKTSTSSRIENSNTSYKTTVKRKSSTESSDIKRSKIKNRTNNDIILSVSESGPSISSVNDWFRRNQPSECEEEGIDLSIKESIQNVLEKLDTTLVEIHQKTSKSFVHMFMDVQEQLANLRQQRYELYKQTANEMLGEMVKLLDTKFVALDKRTQEIDNEFKETLKKRASELIREDCNQKRCMVLLLREDLQAMMIHTQRKRREEDPSYKV